MKHAPSGMRLHAGYALLLLALSLLGCPASLSTEAPDAWVEIAGKRVAVEVADTPAKQRLGLGQRDTLPWDTGMYFPYERPGIYSYWMKGMRFSIDIIWIRNSRIIDLHTEIPFVKGENGPTVRPREAVDAVLEVPAGYTRTQGWRIGDRVKLERVSN